jgi:DNA-binding Lrp family transcriptional regulator
MRVEPQPEAITLIELLKARIDKDIVSKSERTEINLLLDNMAVYVKRVLGMPLSEADLSLSEHPHFGGLVAIPRQRTHNSIVRRLRVVIRFNITSYEKLRRDIVFGLIPLHADSLNGREITLLSLLYQQPSSSSSQLANELGVSTPTVRKQIRELEEKVGLRFTHFVDYRRFKLRHFVVCFKTRGVEATPKLERLFEKDMSTYIKTVVFDASYQRGFVSFLIPDQVRPLRLFQRQLTKLEEVFLETTQIHDITANYTSINFDSFDFETGDWLIEGDVTTLGLITFVKENWDILPKPRGLSNTQMRPFDQLDFYLATFLASEGRPQANNLMNRLARVGIRRPRTTISTRKHKLLKEKSVLPYILFASPLLPVFLTFAIRCDPQIADLLVVAAAQMPFVFASTSEIGCLLGVRASSQCLGAIIHLLTSLHREKGVQEVLQIQQYKNLGSRSMARIGSKWNGSYWTWREEDFLLPSLGLK